MKSTQSTSALMVNAQAVLQEALCLRREVLKVPAPRPKRDVLKLVMLDMIIQQQREQLEMLGAWLVQHPAANASTLPGAA